MLVTNKENFPNLGLGNITLEKNSLNIKAFLTADYRTLKHYLKRNPIIASYAKVYFLVSVPKSKNGLSIPPGILKNPEKRFSNIARYFSISSINSFGWYDKLKKEYYTSSVSLQSVLLNTDMVTDSELTNNKYLKDFNFEIDIDIEEGLYERTDKQEVRVHAFIHLDVKSLLDSGYIKKIGPSIYPYISMGGNLKSRKILQLVEEELRTPETKTILTLEDGTPYNGKTADFGNGPVVPLPTGNKKLLQAETVEKNVSANFLIEKKITPPANPPPEETSKPLPPSYSKPVTIEKPTLTLREDLQQEVYNPYVFEEAVGIETTRQVTDRQASYISNTVHSVSTVGNGCHDIRFTLNWERIVKDKTRLGYLIDVAKRNAALIDTVVVTSGDQKSFNPDNLLRRIKIKELVIKRKRMQTNSFASTSVGTSKKMPSEEYEVLARISDYDYNREYSTNAYSVSTASQTQASKNILLKDYDLYSNASGGEFTYDIELSIEDNNIEYFSSLLSAFRAQLKEYDMALFGIENSPSLKGELKAKDKYKAEANLPVDLDGPISRCIDMYILFLCWTGKTMTRNELVKMRTDIFTMASLANGGTLSGAYKFREYCEQMADRYEVFMKKLNTSPSSEVVSKKSGPKTSKKEMPLIKETFTIPGYSIGIEEEKIVVSFPAGIIPDNLVKGEEKINKGTVSVMPEKFSYKNKASIVKVLSRDDLKAEQAPDIKETKLLILDDAIKTRKMGTMATSKINTAKPPLDMKEVFGLPGISVAVPTSKGTFGSSNPLAKKASPNAEADAKASLGTVLKSSITNSTVNKTGINKIKNQTADEKLRAVRQNVLKKTIRALSMIEDTETKHKVGSIDKQIIAPSADLETEVFKKRSGQLTIGIPSTSGEMEFAPLTNEKLDEIQNENVMVKIMESSSRLKKEEYVAVDNVMQLPKASLKNILNPQE